MKSLPDREVVVPNTRISHIRFDYYQSIIQSPPITTKYS